MMLSSLAGVKHVGTPTRTRARRPSRQLSRGRRAPPAAATTWRAAIGGETGTAVAWNAPETRRWRSLSPIFSTIDLCFASRVKLFRRAACRQGAAQNALRAQRKTVAAMRLRAGAAWTDNDLVFPDGFGELLPYNRAAYVFARLCKRAGIDGHYTPHCLRHSAGTYLTSVGVPDRVTQELLGHSTPTMTRRYQHVLSGMLEDAAKRLDAAFPALKTAG
jgi:integrase-like protein